MKEFLFKTIVCVCCLPMLCTTGCIPTALTAGYSARAAVAEDVTPRVREIFINEAVSMANDYTDKEIYKIKRALNRGLDGDLSLFDEEDEEGKMVQ